MPASFFPSPVLYIVIDRVGYFRFLTFLTCKERGRRVIAAAAAAAACNRPYCAGERETGEGRGQSVYHKLTLILFHAIKHYPNRRENQLCSRRLIYFACCLQICLQVPSFTFFLPIFGFFSERRSSKVERANSSDLLHFFPSLFLSSAGGNDILPRRKEEEEEQ